MGVETELNEFRQFDPNDITSYRFDQVEGTDPIFGKPMYLQPDGSLVSRRGITMERDGFFYELPTVSPTGDRILSNDEAFDIAMETGDYMVFNTQSEADEYSQALSEQLSAMLPYHNMTEREQGNLARKVERETRRAGLENEVKESNDQFMYQLMMMDSEEQIEEDLSSVGGLNMRRAMHQATQFIDHSFLAPAQLLVETAGLDETAADLRDFRDAVRGEVQFEQWQASRLDTWNDAGLWTTAESVAEFAAWIGAFKAMGTLSVAGTYQTSMEQSKGDVALSLGRATTEGLMYILIHKTGQALGKRLAPGAEGIAGRGMAAVERGTARAAGGAVLPKAASGFATPYKVAVANIFKGGKPNLEVMRAVGRVMMQDMKSYGAAASARYGPGLQTWMAGSRAALRPVLINALEITGIGVTNTLVDELITELHRDKIEAMNGIVLDSYGDRVLARNTPGALGHHFAFGLGFGAVGASRGLNRAYRSGVDAQKQYFRSQRDLDARLKSGSMSSQQYFEATQMLGSQFRQFKYNTISSQILGQGMKKADNATLLEMLSKMSQAMQQAKAAGQNPIALRQTAVRLKAEMRRRGLLFEEPVALTPTAPITVSGSPITVPAEAGTGSRRPSAFGGSRRGMMNPALIGMGSRKLSPSDKEQGVSRYLDAQKAAGLKVPGMDLSSIMADMPDTTLQMYGITREQYLDGLKSAAGFDVTQLAPVADLPDNILTYAASQINEPIGANVIIPLKPFRSKVQGDFHNLGLIIPKGDFEDLYMVPARDQVGRARDTLDRLNEIVGGNPVQQFKDLSALGIDEDYGNLILEDFFDKGNVGYGLEVRRIEEQFGVTFLDVPQGSRETPADAGPAGQRLYDDLREYFFLDKQGRLEYALNKARQIGVTPMLGDVIGVTFIDARSGRTARSNVALDKYSRGSGVRQDTTYDRPEGLIHDRGNQVHGASHVLNTNTAVVGSEFSMYQGRARLTILSGKRAELQMHDMKPITVMLEDFIPVDFVEGQSPLTLRPDEVSDLVGNIMARADVETNPKFKKALEEYAAKVANLGYRPRGAGIEPPSSIDQAIYYMNEGITIKEPYFETVDGKRVKKFRDRKIDAEYIRDNFHTIKPSESTKSSVIRETQSAKKRTPEEQKQYEDMKRLLRAEAKGARAAQVGMVPRKTMQEKVAAVKDKLKQDIADLKYDRDLGVEGQRHIVRYIKGQKDLPSSVREQIIGRVNVAGKLDIEDLTKLLDKAEVEIRTVILNQEFKNLRAALSLARRASTSNPTSGYALLPGNRQELETLLNLFGDQPITLDPVSVQTRKKAEEIVANVTEPSLLENAKAVLDTPTGNVGQFYPAKEQLKDLGALDAAHDTARQLREAIEAVMQVNHETQRALAEGRLKDKTEQAINTDVQVRAGNASGILQGKQRVAREMVDKETKSALTEKIQNRAVMMSLDQMLEVFTVNGLAYTEGFAEIYAKDNEFKLVENHNKQYFDNLLLDNGVSPEMQQNFGEAFNKGERVPDAFRITVSDGKTKASLSADELVFYAATLRSTRAVDLYGSGKFDIGPATRGGRSQTISINKEFVESVDEALDALSAKTGFALRPIVEGFVDAFNNPKSPLVVLTKRALIQDHGRSFVQSESGTYMPFAYRTQPGVELLGPEDVIGFSEIEIKEQLEGTMLVNNVFDGMESRAVLGAQADSKKAIATVGAFYFYVRRAQAQAAQFSVNNALGKLHKVFSEELVRRAYSDNGLSDMHANILEMIESIAKFRSGHGTKFRGEEAVLETAINRIAAMTLGFNLPVAIGQSASLEMYNIEGLEPAYHVSVNREFLRNLKMGKSSSSINTFLQGIVQLTSPVGGRVTAGRLREFFENHTMPTIREQIPEENLPIFDYYMEHSQVFRSTASNDSGIQVYSGQTSVEMGSGSGLARMLEDLAFSMIQGKDIQTRVVGGKAFFNQYMDRLETMLSKVALTEEGMKLNGTEEFKDAFGHDFTDAIFAEVQAHVALKLKVENPTRGEILDYVRNNRTEVAGLESIRKVIVSHFDRATTRSQPNFDLLYVNQFGQKTRQDVLKKLLYPYRGYINVHAGQLVLSGMQGAAAKNVDKFEVQRIAEWDRHVDERVAKLREKHEKAQEGVEEDQKAPFDEKKARQDAEDSARKSDPPSEANRRKFLRAAIRSYLSGMKYLIATDMMRAMLDPAESFDDFMEAYNDPDKRREYITDRLARYGLLPVVGQLTSVYATAGLLNDVATLTANTLGINLGTFKSQTVTSAYADRLQRRMRSIKSNVTDDEIKFVQLSLDIIMLGFEGAGLIIPGAAPTAGAARTIERTIPESEDFERKSKRKGLPGARPGPRRSNTAGQR